MTPSPAQDGPRDSASAARTPWWAWLLAGVLLLAGLGVLVWGRGGTAVLLGVALLFGAYAAVRLSVPDGEV
jgi:hypothetical protein